MLKSLLISRCQHHGIELSSISSAIEDEYSIFLSRKNGKKRVIYAPSQSLKVVQRELINIVFKNFPISKHATAYKPRCNIKKNASAHKNSRYLTRIDFSNFFPSIHKEDIKRFLKVNSSILDIPLSSEEINTITHYTCYKDRLVIGAVTSPIIANIICFEMDEIIFSYTAPLGITYTRYADDLYFSSSEPNVLIKVEPLIKTILKAINYPKSLKIKTKKTIHSSKKRRMKATGLIITNDGKISIGRDKKRQIRTQVYRWPQLPTSSRSSLQGYLAYCHSVEPEFIARLRIKFGSSYIDEILSWDSNNHKRI